MQLSEFLAYTTIAVLAVLSPGPDFALVVKNSLSSKGTGVYTALGISLGLAIHVTYTLVGIGFIIAKSILLFNVIKYLGAVYLIYIGIKSLLAKTHQIRINNKSSGEKEITNTQAFINGFLTDVLNPKASLFFLGVFTQIIKPYTPLVIKLFYGVEIMLIAFIWYSLLATVLSHNFIKNKIGKIQFKLEKIMGAVLIILGIKVALSTR